MHLKKPDPKSVFGEGSTTPRNDYPLQKINNEHVLLNIISKTPYPWLIMFDSSMTHVHLRRLNFQISFENQNTVDSKNSFNRLIIPICAKSIYLVLLEIEEKTINQISFFFKSKINPKITVQTVTLGHYFWVRSVIINQIIIICYLKHLRNTFGKSYGS